MADLETGVNLAIGLAQLKIYLEAGVSSFMWGAPGLGKSEGIRQVAKDLTRPLVECRAVLFDPVDLRGLPVVKNGSAVWVPPADLPNEKRDGKNGILFLDELNAAPQSVQAACFQLVLDKKLGTYELPEGWDVVAAGNRQKDRAAANRMPTALANRFGHIDIVADSETWINWAFDNQVDPMIIAFIKFRAELLHSMDGSDLRAFPTPRSWTLASRVCNCEPTMRINVMRGLIGEGPAAEFEGFVNSCEDLPSVDQIIKDPMNARIPEDDNPGGKYAISGAISRAATKRTFQKIMAYAKRLGREFEIVTALAVTKRDPSLCENIAFVEFINRNQDLQI